MAARGLNSAEVSERVAKGEVNSTEVAVSRPYKDIVIKNVCTLFNLIMFTLGLILLLLEKPASAFAATWAIILNVIIATIQEIRAKRRLEKIALLMRPKVTVIRDLQETIIDQSEIVKDDLIVLNPGDQALVDGELLEEQYLEMDESLLTGESHTVRKHVGSMIYSGSYCITGKGYYKVTAFGNEAFASKILTDAKKYKNKMSPLQTETSAVTMLLMTVSFIFFTILVILSIFNHHNPDITGAIALNAVIISDIVPIALFLVTTISYMVAAVRLADTGVLLQRSNSVESMSHVDTICMDKTGTITTNRLVFKDMKVFVDHNEAEEIIRLFISCTGSVNNTVNALLNHFGKIKAEAKDEIRFSSDRKYSAISAEYHGKDISIYMGAVPILRNYLDTDVSECVEDYSKQGLRTVVIAMSDDPKLYEDGDYKIHQSKTIAVIAIEDEVRPDCRQTLQVFIDNGMDFKVISGDDPVTVDALFTTAKIPGKRNLLSGNQLDDLSGEEKTKAILRTNIFGRMNPNHKEEIIETLKGKGKYVAMIGDGVNDVKALKMANVGIALQSGSGAARGVADMVLVNDNFRALPKAFVEGRRTVSGMRDLLKIYLSRNFLIAFVTFFILFVFASIFKDGATPFLPTQASFYAFFSVSIVSLIIPIWAKPDENNDAVLPEVLKYAIPTAVIAGTFALVIYVIFYIITMHGVLDIRYTDYELALMGWPSFNNPSEMFNHYEIIPLERQAEINARNAMLMFCTFEGIMQIFMVTPYWKSLSINGKVHNDIKPTILAFTLCALVGLTYYFAQKYDWLFEFIPIRNLSYPYDIFIIGFVVLWFFVNLYAMRSGKLDWIADITEKRYNRKVDKVNTISIRQDQGIDVDPFADITGKVKNTGKTVKKITINGIKESSEKLNSIPKKWRKNGNNKN
ncbi:MAG: HAD-IC family P-type ATPase [archaeon]|nr:HAD-IC family P-type ATPase [archaeon]